jgi:hypothetical protein
MAEPQNLDVPFPVGGMEVSVAYGDQPPNTTPLGVNVRSYDPILDRRRGGCRVGLSKFADQIPAGTHLIQHLAELVDPRADNLIGNFEDFMPGFVPDPRNPARMVPPQGSGSMPSVGWPPAVFRRVQLTASSTTPTDGATVTLTATLFLEPAGTVIAGQTITLATIPRGRDGDGDSAVTNGSGIATFTVSEATFEGSIVYFAANQYHRAGIPFPSVARGIVTVVWKPNYTLAVVSVDGTTLDADGKSHPMVIALTNTTTGLPIAGRTILLETTPSGEVGDGRISVTNSHGLMALRVSDSNPESVLYSASMLPGQQIQGSTTIDWGVPPIFAFTEGGGGSHVYGSKISVRLFASSTDSPTMTPVEGVVMTLLASTGDPFTPVGDGHVFAATGKDGYTAFVDIVQTDPGFTPVDVNYKCAAVALPFTLKGNVGVPGTNWHT